MGMIEDKFASTYRDFTTDGVPTSGLHEPKKADLRALGPAIESAMASLGLAGTIDAVFATKALMDADIAYDEGAQAIVYADPDPAKNDIYVKVGATGAGNWALIGSNGLFHDVIDAIADPIITDAAERVGQAAELAAAKLAAISDAAYKPLLARPRTGKFDSGTFRRWATGATGDLFAEGAIIDAVVVSPVLIAGTASVEARIFSVPGVTGEVQPNMSTDTAEWSAWVALDATGLATGVPIDLRFEGPEPVAVDNARTYYAVVTARNAGGDIVNMGYGRWNPAAGAGTDYNQLERAWTTNDSAADNVWFEASANSLVPIRFETGVQTVGKENLPPAAGRADPGNGYKPSRRIGSRIWAGRMDYAASNTATDGRTYQVIAGVPNADVVAVRPLFAHCTTATEMRVEGVAAAAIDTAATNFDTTGATWTRGTFHDGVALSRSLAAAPAAKRRSWGAGDWIDLEVPQRADDPAAARLVAFLCHIKQRGNLTLMGESDGSTDYTGWANEDRPLVMRAMDGDKLTDPATFDSTVNISYSPIVGVQYLLASGEVVTLGGPGDSITDGAGNAAAPFGKAWGYIAAQALEKPWRHADWANLAWSGIDMVGIRNLTVDFYTFCKAENVRVPTILFIPAMTPNSVPSAGAVDADFEDQRPYTEANVQTAQEGGSIPVVWTMIPVNPAADDYDGVDVTGRIAQNDLWLAEGADQSGIIIADMSAIMSGVVDGDGQTQMVAGTNGDAIHPNETGYGLDYMGGVAKRAAKVALTYAGFAVGASVV